MAAINFALLVGIFTSVLTAVRAGDWCWTDKIEYCDYGCCSSKCCSSEVGVIVGAIIGGLIVLAVIIGLIILCIYLAHQKKHRSIHGTGRVIQTNPNVIATTTSTGPYVATGAHMYPAPQPMQPMGGYYTNTAMVPNPPTYSYGAPTTTTTTTTTEM